MNASNKIGHSITYNIIGIYKHWYISVIIVIELKIIIINTKFNEILTIFMTVLL